MPDVISTMERIRVLLWIIIIILAVAIVMFIDRVGSVPTSVIAQGAQPRSGEWWQPPSLLEVANDSLGALIRYGRELIQHTATFLGPKGSVNQISNGMNCQNCHLEAGTKPFAANYGAVASTYPKFRARSGTVEGFEKRVNDCIERSLNGTALPSSSRELNAIIAYLKWLGKNVPKSETPTGAGLKKLPFLNRAADPLKGHNRYLTYCASCHGINGQGLRQSGNSEWQYPPLWGPDSYNTGAGLYRLSMFAAFIKSNMPLGTTFENPVLSDEEAWDIAAYVNSMPRPHKTFAGDWPDVNTKPVDHPFGPYADSFPESRHKFGPFTGMNSIKR